VIDFHRLALVRPELLRPSLHWPTFNVADSGISVGLVMLFLDMLFAKKPPRNRRGRSEES